MCYLNINMNQYVEKLCEFKRSAHLNHQNATKSADQWESMIPKLK